MAIRMQNPHRFGDSRNRTATIQGELNAIGNEDATLNNLEMNVNGRELLSIY